MLGGLTSFFGWGYVASAGFNPGEGASRGRRTDVPQRGALLSIVARRVQSERQSCSILFQRALLPWQAQGHSIYTSVARGCDGTASNIAAMDKRDPLGS